MKRRNFILNSALFSASIGIHFLLVAVVLTKSFKKILSSLPVRGEMVKNPKETLRKEYDFPS